MKEKTVLLERRIKILEDHVYWALNASGSNSVKKELEELELLRNELNRIK